MSAPEVLTANVAEGTGIITAFESKAPEPETDSKQVSYFSLFRYTEVSSTA